MKCKICKGKNSGEVIVKSDGMGVESVAITLRWFREPQTRDFCLCQLVVITSQTGNEHEDTKQGMERFILPLYREHGIRFVEVARAGHTEAEGIVVFQDGREPTELNVSGAYKLSDELMMGGTVPQFGGEHRCSLKFKAWVIEHWLANYFDVRGFRHAFGYNADEQSRADKCVAATEARNELVRVAFGYNSEEPRRAEKAIAADDFTRVGIERKSFFPLIEWGWDREDCLRYIFDAIGVVWDKSACTYCPFNQALSKATEHGLKRFVSDEAGALLALRIEYLSLCMNPRGALFNTKTLREIIEAAGYSDLIEAHLNDLTDREWAMYRVRRIYSKKGKADRCVELTNGVRGAYANVAATFEAFATDRKRIQSRSGIEYLVNVERGEEYPTGEEFLVMAPYFIETKARYGVPWFDAKWDLLLHPQFDLFGNEDR